MTLLKNYHKIVRVCTRGLASHGQKTCLYDFHVKHGGKMVDFGGWSMPVQYNDMSIAQSTLHTRQHASLFDVSHMLQTKIYGNERIAFIESIIPGDIEALSEDTGTLSVLLNKSGGIIDDLIVTKTSHDHVYIVTNAACIEQDLKFITEHAKSWKNNWKDVVIEPQHGRGLVALQGPKAAQILQKGVKDPLDTLYFMHSRVGNVFGIDGCRITRCGYTGEDGFEISVDGSACEQLVTAVMAESSDVKLAGLGARDALRLEAGLCLYGSDIGQNTTPVHAGLTWLVAKRRRQLGDFPGASVIMAQIDNKAVDVKRVGFVSEPGRVPRKDTVILDQFDRKIGHITSGCPSPCLQKNISMGYVKLEQSKIGTNVHMDIGGKGKDYVNATVTKMPFIKSHYYLPPKQ